MTVPPRKMDFKKSGFQEKQNLQEVPGRSLVAESDLIIKGIKKYFVRWLTLCNAFTKGFKGRLPRQKQKMLHNASCWPG